MEFQLWTWYSGEVVVLGDIFQNDTHQPYRKSQHSERNLSHTKDLESGQVARCAYDLILKHRQRGAEETELDVKTS